MNKPKTVLNAALYSEGNQPLKRIIHYGRIELILLFKQRKSDPEPLKSMVKQFLLQFYITISLSTPKEKGTLLK